MELSAKNKTIKYLIYGALILAAALLQNISGLFPQLFGARCFLLIPTAVLLGLGEDEKISALLGLFAGFLWDMLSAQHMGFSCIYLMLICYLSSVLVTFLFRNTFLYGVIASGLAAFFYAVLYWAFFILIGGGEGKGGALLFFYIPCFIYTAVITPVLYLILNPVKTKLNKMEMLDK